MTDPSCFQLRRAMPVLDCTDMVRSVAFYKEKLGFDARVWGEPVTFAILQRGVVTIALAKADAGKAAVSRNWAAYVYVRDVDALHAELSAHGVVAETPAPRDYNCRDFTVDDPDGHMIAFGQVLEPDVLGPGLSERIGRDGRSP